MGGNCAWNGIPGLRQRREHWALFVESYSLRTGISTSDIKCGPKNVVVHLKDVLINTCVTSLNVLLFELVSIFIMRRNHLVTSGAASRE
jgi:hypothetical protein